MSLRKRKRKDYLPPGKVRYDLTSPPMMSTQLLLSHKRSLRRPSLSEPSWSPTHRLWTPSGISSALSKSRCLLLTWLQEKISQTFQETGGGKVVSKKQSLNPDEVEAVSESIEKEATEIHDDQKAMEVGSPVPVPSEKVKSSEETFNVDKDDSTEDKADTRPRRTTRTKVIDTVKDDSSTTATSGRTTRTKVITSTTYAEPSDKEEVTS